jgi:hypothetical protein
MCGISAIITPYGYAPALDPPPGSFPGPQEPEDTLKRFARELTKDLPASHRRPAHQDQEVPIHVDFEDSDAPPKKVNGHAGKAGYRETLVEELKQSLGRISHRGPDGQGIWISSDARVGESLKAITSRFGPWSVELILLDG